MSAEASAGEADLTPILDMVFQLITFFMLIINFKGSEFDQSIKLPILGSARPVDTKGEEDILVLNINSDGELINMGQVKDLEKVIRSQGKKSLALAKLSNPKVDEKDLPTMVMVRADGTIPFKKLKRILDVCQEVGFRRFSLRAMNKKPEKKA